MTSRDERVAGGKLGMGDSTLSNGDTQRIEMYARPAPVEIVWAGATLTLSVLDIVGALPILARHAVDCAR